MGDLGSALTGALGSIGNGIGTVAGDIGSSLGSIAGDIGGLFSGGQGASAAPPSSAPLPSLAASAPVAASTPPTVPTGAASAASIAAPLPNEVGGLGGLDAAGTLPNVTNYSTPIAGVSAPSSAAPAAGGGILQQIFGSTGGGKSIAQDAIGGGSILMDLLNANKAPPGTAALKSLAGTDAGLAASYGAQAQAEGQGILPAGAEALVQNNLNSQIAGIKANYAKMGMSGSSSETQDINAAKAQSLAQVFQIGQGMAAQGLQEVTQASGQESTLLQEIMNAEINQNTALGQALAGFAGASAK